MGRGSPTGLHIIDATSGEPALEVMADTHVVVSSGGLGWEGIVVESGVSSQWAPDNLAIAGHLVALNLDSEPLHIETKGPHGFVNEVMPPGTLWINPAHRTITQRNLGTAHWAAVELSVDAIRRALGREIELRPRYGIVDEPLTATLRALLLEAEAGGSSGPLFPIGMAIAIASRLAHHAGLRPETFAPVRGMSAQRLNRVKEKIEHTMATGITVDDLAAEAGLSPAHFARGFKRETNETPHAFVMRRRVERARDLMAAGTSIADAALKCGFSDQPHLSRAFKLRFALTPGAFVRATRGR